MTYQYTEQNPYAETKQPFSPNVVDDFSDPENPKAKGKETGEEFEMLTTKEKQSIDQKLLRNNEAFINLLTSLSGDMEHMKQRISGIPGLHGDVIRIFDAWLRGIGQVGFMNNPICGAGILACALWDNYWVACCGIISSLWVTILAYLFLPGKRDLHKEGLLTFNPYLLGACWATFLLSPWDYRLIVMILFYAPVILVTQLAFIKILGKIDSPAFTLPYIVHALFFLIGTYNFGVFGDKLAPPVLLPHYTPLEFSAQIALDSFSQGVGQVYFIANTWPGLTTLLCYLLYSPFHALAAFLGSTMGVSLGYAFHGNLQDIRVGFWGFNPVLTYLALFAVFLDRSWASFVYGFFGSLATVVLYGGLKSVFTLGGIPTLTLPFSIATVFFMVARDSFNFPTSEPAPPPSKNDTNPPHD